MLLNFNFNFYGSNKILLYLTDKKLKGIMQTQYRFILRCHQTNFISDIKMMYNVREPCAEHVVVS